MILMHVRPEMLEPELEAFLTKAFSKHFLLKSVPASECKALVLSMKVKHAVPGEDTWSLPPSLGKIGKKYFCLDMNQIPCLDVAQGCPENNPTRWRTSCARATKRSRCILSGRVYFRKCLGGLK